jgi:hypothetical protein
MNTGDEIELLHHESGAWRIVTSSFAGTLVTGWVGGFSEFAVVRHAAPTGVANAPRPPSVILRPAYPNSFNPMTRIEYALQAPGRVTLDIYDVAGRLVTRLSDGSRPAGEYVASWDGRNGKGQRVASGVYFLRLASDDATLVRKITLVR